jgi:hypothetical protein
MTLYEIKYRNSRCQFQFKVSRIPNDLRHSQNSRNRLSILAFKLDWQSKYVPQRIQCKDQKRIRFVIVNLADHNKRHRSQMRHRPNSILFQVFSRFHIFEHLKNGTTHESFHSEDILSSLRRLRFSNMYLISLLFSNVFNVFSFLMVFPFIWYSWLPIFDQYMRLLILHTSNISRKLLSRSGNSSVHDGNCNWEDFTVKSRDSSLCFGFAVGARKIGLVIPARGLELLLASLFPIRRFFPNTRWWSLISPKLRIMVSCTESRIITKLWSQFRWLSCEDRIGTFTALSYDPLNIWKYKIVAVYIPIMT